MSDDQVNSPNHYNAGGIEVIDIIEGWGLGFCLGNAVKYVLRAQHKGNAKQDYEKAQWYVQRVINRYFAGDLARSMVGVEYKLSTITVAWNLDSYSIEFLEAICAYLDEAERPQKSRSYLEQAQTAIGEMIQAEINKTGRAK